MPDHKQHISGCVTCGEPHGTVTAKQALRDEQMCVICDRLDKTVSFSTFSWILGILIVVLMAAADGFAAAQDSKLDSVSQRYSDRLATIEKQNTEIIQTVKETNATMNKLAESVAVINDNVKRNRSDIDRYMNQR